MSPRQVAIVLGTLAFLVSAFPLASSEPLPARAPLGSTLADVKETLQLPRATWYNDLDGDKIFDDLEKRFASHPFRALSVIVTMRDGTPVEAAIRSAKAAAGGFEPTYVYPRLFGFAAPLTLDQVERIAKLRDVRQIEWDTPGTPELDTATVNFGARAVQEHLRITGDRDGVPEKFGTRDVVVAILDTGFDGKHVDLAGKFVAFVDAKDQKLKDPYDTGAHGTHVASIVGGLGVGQAKYRGVAPGAAFVGIQITGAAPYGGATGSKAGALFGVDWILQNRETYNIRISTISFGFGITRDGTDALELAFDRAFASGVLPFKSNGNSGPEKGTTTIPGGARGIVSVGSMLDPGRVESAVPPVAPLPVSTDEYGFHISSYSSRGPTADGRIKPDVAAPGQSVMAASNGTKDGYVAFSGTSMASPFAAGTAALVMAADPKLNVSQVREILFATAEDWGPPGPDVDYGHGRLDSLRAVQSALLGRLQREGAPYERLVEVANATRPDLPFHAFGKFTSNTGSKSFVIQDAKKPVAVTFLLNASLPLPSAPIVGSPLSRPWMVSVRGPSDVLLGRGPIPSSARQALVTFLPQGPGTYQAEVFHAGANWEVTYDVSAGLPPPAVLPIPVLPEPMEYAEKAAKIRALEGGGKSTSSVPGFSAAALFALALLVLARRRFA